MGLLKCIPLGLMKIVHSDFVAPAAHEWKESQSAMLAAFVALHIAALQPAGLRSTRSRSPRPICELKPMADAEGYDVVVKATRETGRLAVIQFSSEQCSACAKMDPRIQRMSSGWPEDLIEFHTIKFEDNGNRKLFKSLDVRFLPHIHIAAHGQAVESFSCPPGKLLRIEDKLEVHGGNMTRMRMHRGWLSGRRWRQLRQWWTSRDGGWKPALNNSSGISEQLA